MNAGADGTGRDAVHDDLAWLDRDAYPFETACLGLPAGAVHYVNDEAHFRRFSWLAGGPIGRRARVRYNAFVRLVVPLAFADRSRFTRLARALYALPLSDPADRTGTWVFPRELVGSTDWLRTLWSRRDALAPLPARILRGTEDPAFRAEELRTYEAVFDDPSVVRLRGVGHYVQEELGPDLVPYVRQFLDALA